MDKNDYIRQFVLDNFIEQIPDSDMIPDDLDKYTYFKLGDGYQYKVSNDKVIKNK